MLKKRKPQTIKEKVQETLLGAAAGPDSGRQVWCYGVYKAADGNWIMRQVICDQNQVLEFKDSEPDILAIQMGKIELAVSMEAERQINGFAPAE